MVNIRHFVLKNLSQICIRVSMTSWRWCDVRHVDKSIRKGWGDSTIPSIFLVMTYSAVHFAWYPVAQKTPSALLGLGERWKREIVFFSVSSENAMRSKYRQNSKWPPPVKMLHSAIAHCVYYQCFNPSIIVQQHNQGSSNDISYNIGKPNHYKARWLKQTSPNMLHMYITHQSHTV